VDNACRYPVMTYQPTVGVLEVLAGQLSYITVGLNAWVITNGPEKARRAGEKAMSSCTTTAALSSQ
jgi:hypothetical protein